MALLAGALVAFVGVGPANAAAPDRLQTEAFAAAGSQQSVHYVSRATGQGGTLVQVSDVSRDRGIQRITFSAGGNTGTLTVIDAKGAVYVRGDLFMLGHYEGFTAAQARAYAGKWVRIPPASALYRTTATDVTLSSFLSDLRLRGPLGSVAGVVVAGQHTIGLRGKPVNGGQSGTLYTASVGKPLPVKEVVRASGGTASVVLSHWNEQVPVNAPAAVATLPSATTTA